jgi:hypothetical protein
MEKNIYTYNYRNNKFIYKKIKKKDKDNQKLKKNNINLPLEVIYDVIQKFILPYKPNKCILKYNVNKKEYSTWFSLSKEFYKMNKLLYHSKCINGNYIIFENKYWCSFCNSSEYNIANKIKNQMINKERFILGNFCNLENNYKKVNYLHKDNVLLNNISNMEYYNKFQNVIENTNYEITHSCCNGKGIGYVYNI